ncbi:hypothetical protein [Frankia sp. AgW1.1]|uniref:hypothetical protein n=1 Tax=Frankia sp. AgW1.1 TaxID=1836971 RepID=UPI001933642F|nr:hypothetical protein [Frankia sp. AgW1.1]
MSWRLRELLDWVDEDPVRAVDLRPELQRIAAAIDRLPSRSAEMTAGSPENFRALARLLEPYVRCTGHRENCGAGCLGGGLCQVLAMAYANVGAELERQEKTDG